MNTLEDTIAAIATPVGEAGIAVIRVSGPRAIEICDQRFRGKKKLETAATQTAHYGDFENRDGEKLDEVIATIFREPHSFTAEDVVEISCHGGSYVTRAILGELLECGARPAEPGEFTKRAFLNGRIDLSQAEAVADLIHARSKSAHNASMQQLSGKISHSINDLRQRILDLSSLIELELDFSEEGIELLKREELHQRLKEIIQSVQILIDTYETGKILREGVKVVIAGRPNVGKSSILNSLLNYDRAIVSEIPGTTRDTLEESISIEGLLFSITDTAGLRQSSDSIEEMGIQRTRRELQNADITLVVLDASDEESEEDVDLIKQCRAESMNPKARLLILKNKTDLPAKSPEVLKQSNHDDLPVLEVSARTGKGIESLRNKLLVLASTQRERYGEGSAVITSQRHQGCLKLAKEFLDGAQAIAASRLNSELIAENLNMSTKALGEIIGAVTSDDILNNIFSHFCIGK